MTAEPAPADHESANEPAEGALARVERGYVQLLRLHALLTFLPLMIGAVVLDRLVLAKTPAGGLLLVLVPLLAAIIIVTAPPRMWARLGYALEPAMLRVVR